MRKRGSELLRGGRDSVTLVECSSSSRGREGEPSHCFRLFHFSLDVFFLPLALPKCRKDAREFSYSGLKEGEATGGETRAAAKERREEDSERQLADFLLFRETLDA